MSEASSVSPCALSGYDLCPEKPDYSWSRVQAMYGPGKEQNHYVIIYKCVDLPFRF